MRKFAVYCSLASCLSAGVAQAADILPLKRGFYVVNKVKCGEASNASLTLFRGDILAIYSRDDCENASTKKIGANTYKLTQRCTSGNDGSEYYQNFTVKVTKPTEYVYMGEDGLLDSRFRYCPQSQLPDPWRHNDLSDILK